MTPEMVVDIGKGALETALLLAAPMLAMSLIIGLSISIFQAVTQINEATLAFVPKVIGVFVAVLMFLPWMIRVIVGYTTNLFLNIPNYIH